MGLSMIYSQVIGSLSNSILKAIPGNSTDFLLKHLSPFGIVICRRKENGELCLVGTLENITSAADLLAKIILDPLVDTNAATGKLDNGKDNTEVGKVIDDDVAIGNLPPEQLETDHVVCSIQSAAQDENTYDSKSTSDKVSSNPNHDADKFLNDTVNELRDPDPDNSEGRDEQIKAVVSSSDDLTKDELCEITEDDLDTSANNASSQQTAVTSKSSVNSAADSETDCHDFIKKDRSSNGHVTTKKKLSFASSRNRRHYTPRAKTKLEHENDKDVDSETNDDLNASANDGSGEFSKSDNAIVEDKSVLNELPKSKFGRVIKVPNRLKRYDTDFEEPLVEDMSDSDSPDYVENDNTKDKLKRKSTKVKDGKVKVRILGPEADKKNLKKYYEDRMPYKYFCDLCSFKSKRNAQYDKHMALHKKPGTQIYQCDLCDFKTIRTGVLFKHKVVHVSDVLKCVVAGCNYETWDFVKLDLHLKNKHPPASLVKLKCQLCNFSTLSRNKLTSHFNEEHTKNEGDMLFSCDQCTYKTKKKINLTRHVDSIHKNRRPHLCELCGMSFKRVDALRSHKETHLDRSQRHLPYSCPECGKTFRALSTLSEHKAVHSSRRSLQCHICGQLFKTVFVHRRHIQTVHNNRPKFSCTTCKKEFTSKYILKRHEKNHEDYHAGLTLAAMESRILNKSRDPAQADGSEGLYEVRVDSRPDNGQEKVMIDENTAAIETITIKSEVLEQLQYINQLPTAAQDQLPPSADVDSAYIQDLNTADDGTMVVSHPKYLAQTFTTSDTHDLTANNIVTLPSSTEIYQTTIDTLDAATLESAADVDKATSILLTVPEPNTSNNPDYGNQQVFDISMLDGLQQQQIITNIDEGHVIQLVTQDGQTMHVKLDSIQNFLSLTSTDTTGQKEDTL